MVGAIRRQPAAPGTAKTAGSWIVGVFSHNDRRARAFAEELAIPNFFSELDQLLRRTEVHCVYLSTYPSQHKELAMAALQAGKHVLCETPMALSMSDAREMAQEAARRNLLLGVNYVWRADPALVAMKAMIDRGEIGDVAGGRVNNTLLLPPHLQNWRLRPGGGVVMDRTHHDVDVIRWLLDDEIALVSALSCDPVLAQEAEDNVTVNIRLHRSGSLFQLHDSYTVPHQANSVRVFGTKGTLIARHTLSYQPESELLLVRNDRVHMIPLPSGDPYCRSVEAFNAAVRSRVPGLGTADGAGTQPLVDAADGMRNLQAALAIRDSIQSGWAVSLT
jgi:1,5-anhydro-D-fructose reductase (1,5-anhydro-D-mannitol-forming)